MTFDIENRHFLFARAAGNTIPGDITSVSELLDLSLRASEVAYFSPSNASET
jgi:hypothetical protein